MNWIRPLLFKLDPERAHEAAISLLGTPFPCLHDPASDPALRTRLAGLSLPNPLGMGAGFDKNARAVSGLLKLGFGFAEAGTVTPLPQTGNPRPRLFRLEEDRAVINRMGFNNEGVGAAVERLRASKGKRLAPVGLNVGLNKDRADKPEDYEGLIIAASEVADYVTVNISSPNTPGLRALQSQERFIELTRIIAAAKAACAERAVPVFIKIAPDATEEELEAIADAARSRRTDALILGNTTLSRPESLRSSFKGETGGLSGEPLKALAMNKLRRLCSVLRGEVPVIACGGIDSGEEVLARLKAGAGCVQIYTALIYRGPGAAKAILRELSEAMLRYGIKSLAELSTDAKR